MILAVPFLIMAMGCFIESDNFVSNQKLRTGVHNILGAPDTTYSFRYASTVLFGIPALILIGRSLFAPKVSQTISLAVGGFPASVIITSCFFGRTDFCSMLLFGTISLGLIVYGLQPSTKLDDHATKAK